MYCISYLCLDTNNRVGKVVAYLEESMINTKSPAVISIVERIAKDPALLEMASVSAAWAYIYIIIYKRQGCSWNRNEVLHW
jgi:hypothetical protein